MPLQNKFKEYHKKREFDWPTIEMLQHFPCHFGLIDAIWSADGIWGLKFDDKPNKTNTIIDLDQKPIRYSTKSQINHLTYNKI